MHPEVMNGGTRERRASGLSEKQCGAGVDVYKDNFRCRDRGFCFFNNLRETAVNGAEPLA